MQFTLAVLLVIIFPLLVDVVTIIYIFKNNQLSQLKKILWFSIVCLLPIFGAMGYFMYVKFAGKRQGF
ncbi:MAG: hypothetical protein EAZ15_05020 [Sphingobacteriales bacterium]|nr:MAG: hypothetical protein EAZ15_05020 [Sphingobacteriales bacterium]